MSLLTQDWDKVTPFNALAVYVQYDADAVPGSEYPSIEQSFVQAVTRDGGLIYQPFYDRKRAAEAAMALVSRLPGLNTLSVDPLVAVRKNCLQNADTDSNRVVLQLQGDRNFYLQYNTRLEAQGFATRMRQNLGLGR